jgi:hypothetical protein
LSQSSREGGRESGRQSDSVISELRDIQGEFAQLSELQEIERNYSMKLVDSLKLLQSVVDDVIPVDVSALGEEHQGAQSAFLAADAVVIISDDEGRSESVPLTRFESPQILAVIQAATPKLKKVISDKRRMTAERVEILEKLLKELKKAGSTLKQTRHEVEPAEEEDLVSSSIASE